MTALFLLISLTTQIFSPVKTTGIEFLDDQATVEAAVVNWADSSFIKHENYKFENFNTVYTDDYSMQSMRVDLYQEKIATLKTSKEQGTYTGTSEEFMAEIVKLETSINEINEQLKVIERVDYYSIHFWSNIQTIDGITVYYELILKLDKSLAVIEALENSSIGKKNQGSKIAYLKTNTQVKVTEK